MTSNHELRTRLKKIIRELKKYEGKDKRIVLGERIEERLNRSLKEYYNKLNNTLDKLYNYADDGNEIKLMKRINKGELN